MCLAISLFPGSISLLRKTVVVPMSPVSAIHVSYGQSSPVTVLLSLENVLEILQSCSLMYCGLDNFRIRTEVELTICIMHVLSL